MMDSISDETASKETIVTLKFPDATHANKRIRLGVFFFFLGWSQNLIKHTNGLY